MPFIQAVLEGTPEDASSGALTFWVSAPRGNGPRSMMLLLKPMKNTPPIAVPPSPAQAAGKLTSAEAVTDVLAVLSRGVLHVSETPSDAASKRLASLTLRAAALEARLW